MTDYISTEALKVAGIPEEGWRNKTPEHRQTTYKYCIKKAYLNYHPDRVRKNHPDATEAELKQYAENIRLLNGIDYELDLESNVSSKSIWHSYFRTGASYPASSSEGKAEAKADASYAIPNLSFFSTGVKTTGEYMRYGGQVLNVLQNSWATRIDDPFVLWSYDLTVERILEDVVSTALGLGIAACFMNVSPVVIAALLVSPMLLVLGLGLSSLGEYLEEPAHAVPGY